MSSTPLKLLPFAQARDLLGFSEMELPHSPNSTPRIIVENLSPGFTSAHRTFRVALDEEYVSWDQPLLNSKVLAIIPPVSGG